MELNPSTSEDNHPSTSTPPQGPQQPPKPQQPPPPLSRYEAQKRRDWNTFLQYLKSHKPPVPLSRSSGKEVIEFLGYLDQFGKTKVHSSSCCFYGQPNPPSACACPLRQAWGSLDALVGRLRAAYEENGGKAENNPLGARAVRTYLREVRDSQSKARGVAYEKKRRRKVRSSPGTAGEASSSSGAGGGVGARDGAAAAIVTVAFGGGCLSRGGEESGFPPGS